MSPQPAIEDYAMIGDGRSAALVSKSGSIDWLCWPRFDSPSVFGALLDEKAGFWRISPIGPTRVARRYVGATNVLETRFECETGTLVVTDFMPIADPREPTSLFEPDHEVLRLASCEGGSVDVEHVFAPCPGYAAERTHLVDAGALGLRTDTRRGLLTLRTTHPIHVNNGQASGRMRLHADETLEASLTFALHDVALLPPLGARSRGLLDRTRKTWETWASQFTYDGPERDAVLRSALALKLLIYEHSGAVVAAPTTSLPERPGGDLNWDYRYCWLRDASLTMRALVELGFEDEAETFITWLIHSTRLSRAPLRVLYDVYGNKPVRERALPFQGYRGARPVRVGNAAIEQLQLDVYGEVIDAAVQFLRPGRHFDRSTQAMLRAFGDYACNHWREPDEGIWEPRGARERHTHSLLLCWTALDRMIRLHDAGHLVLKHPDRYQRERAEIRRVIETEAWSESAQSYVSTLGGTAVDASLLLLSWYGFHPADSPRMRSTYESIRTALGAGGGLLYRYRDGVSPGEGAFGICSFWGVEYLALGGGEEREACDTFHALCAHANDVGLFAEELDPRGSAQLGNFPQAFTHIGLINAGLTLQHRLACGAHAALRPVKGVECLWEAAP